DQPRNQIQQLFVRHSAHWLRLLPVILTADHHIPGVQIQPQLNRHRHLDSDTLTIYFMYVIIHNADRLAAFQPPVGYMSSPTEEACENLWTHARTYGRA
ncbi:MAG: hypothetical protein LC114_03920, partial [Bryobacterales bacterium]|nr:hypothetical protein [Bryobacterales bacterium]